MKLNQATKLSPQSVLVYGPPKTGKTQLVGQLAAEFKLLWIDLENGHATLFKLPPEQQERVELVVLPDTRSYPIAIESCLKIIKGGQCFIDDETGKVITDPKLKKADRAYTEVWLNQLSSDTVVVFDSLTQLTNSAIAHITKNQPDDYKLNYDDWGNLGKLMDIFLSHVQQAKFNVVCISHETETEMEDGKIRIVPTAGTRNFSRNTAKYFGHVVYTQLANKKHSAISSTVALMNVIVGSRTDVDTGAMAEPSLIPIFKSGYEVPKTNGQKALASLVGMVKK